VAERLTHHTGGYPPGAVERDHKKNPLPQEEEHRERGATPRSLFFSVAVLVHGELLIKQQLVSETDLRNVNSRRIFPNSPG
jgi:hypothetical protein